MEKRKCCYVSVKNADSLWFLLVCIPHNTFYILMFVNIISNYHYFCHIFSVNNMSTVQTCSLALAHPAKSENTLDNMTIQS